MTTTDWIKMSDWRDLIDGLNEGETVCVDHTDCPAGQDTKHRLYFTKPVYGGVVLAYCHNCGSKGVKRGEQEFRKDNNVLEVVVPRGEFKIPKGMVNTPMLWPVEATKWRIDKSLTQEQCIKYNIKYDPSSNRIYLPLYEEHGLPELDGYQLRLLKGSGPKYTTVLRDSDTIPSTIIQARQDSNIIVLVEDLASGICVAEVENKLERVGVIVNYGIKNTPIVLNRTNKGAEYNIVWLDNDSPLVTERAREIARTWGLISGVQSFVIKDYRDPKHYYSEAIQAIIREAIGNSKWH